MNFSELVDAVVTDTNRPDKTFTSKGGDGTIPLAIVSATLKMHTVDFFFKDILHSVVTFPTEAFNQQLDTLTLLRFRNISYCMKKNDSLVTPPAVIRPSDLFEAINDLGALFSISGTEKRDVFYQLGTVLNFRSSTSFSHADFGWYAYPLVGSASNDYLDYRSWIADEFPFAIIYDASSKIFNSIGQDDMSRKYDSPVTRTSPGGLVQQQIAALQAANITVRGR